LSTPWKGASCLPDSFSLSDQLMNSQEILCKLISFPTVSDRENLPMIDWAADYLRAVGAHVEIINAPEEGKAILWARLGPNVAGGVVLAGHCDVVPVEEQPWTKEPFKGTVTDDRIYGRGACDMKGFEACALAAAARLDLGKLAKPLYIALTYNEEVGMDGARQLVAWLKQQKVSVDWIWVGEPTEMQVVTAHKGTGAVTTTVTGATAHSSLPHKGLSANDVAIKIGTWIIKKSEAWATMPVIGSPFDPPYSTINVGMIHGGQAPNIVSGHCELRWQYRLHPGDDIEALFRDYEMMLDNSIRPHFSKFPSTGVKTVVESRIPPFMAPVGSVCEKFLCAHTGSGVPVAVSYATEAGLYQDITRSVVICGPGSITKAHMTDEFVPLADLAKCDKLIDECVRAFLMS